MGNNYAITNEIKSLKGKKKNLHGYKYSLEIVKSSLEAYKKDVDSIDYDATMKGDRITALRNKCRQYQDVLKAEMVSNLNINIANIANEMEMLENRISYLASQYDPTESEMV